MINFFNLIRDWKGLAEKMSLRCVRKRNRLVDFVYIDENEKYMKRMTVTKNVSQLWPVAQEKGPFFSPGPMNLGKWPRPSC